MSPHDEAQLRALVHLDAQFRLASCIGKGRFADRALAVLSVRPEKRGFVKPYRCKFCSSWHVGTEPRGAGLHRMFIMKRKAEERRA